MDIVYPQTEPDQQLWRSSLGVPPASWGETLKTTAEEALVRSPTSSLLRMNELNRVKYDLETPETPGWLPIEPPGPVEEPDSPFLTNEEYRASPFFRKGLEFPDGVKEDVARILSDRHDEEQKRKEVLSRAPGGLLGKGAMLATDLLASALDPLNLASAFVPVVGEARFAGWAAKYGKPVARALRGGIEGSAGAALTEPLVLSAAKQEQADYGMTDSLLNVGLGGVLGGGLHVGAGAVKDLVTRARFNTREGALRAAVGQFADERDVNVESLFKADDRIGESAELSRAMQGSGKLPDIPLPRRELTEADLAGVESPRLAGADREVESLFSDLGKLQERGLIEQADIDLLRGEVSRSMDSVNEYRRAVSSLADCLIG